MKKIISLALSCLLAAGLWGCGAKPAAETTVPVQTTVQTTTADATIPQAQNPAQDGSSFAAAAAADPEAAAYYASLDRDSEALLAYDAVMNANRKFVDVHTNDSIGISRMLENRSAGDSVTIRQLTLADLGQDGTPELILWLAAGSDQQFGFKVLRYDGGEVYGYEVAYRCFDQLKIDGTYQVNEASGSGYSYGTMIFNGPNWGSVGGSTPSADEDAAHAAKPDVIWFSSWMNFLYPAAEGISFESILTGKSTLTDAYTQEPITIDQAGSLLVPEEIPTHIKQLAVVDMDQDGTQEVVLQIATESDDYIGFVILRLENGQVYGEGYYYRPFHGLKTDGTYRFSGSSSDHGYGRKQFVNGQWVETILAECYTTTQEGGSEVMVYFVNGEFSDTQGFAAFEQQQDAKADVLWYDSWASYQAANG